MPLHIDTRPCSAYTNLKFNLSVICIKLTLLAEESLETLTTRTGESVLLIDTRPSILARAALTIVRT